MGRYTGELIRDVIVCIFWAWIFSKIARKAGYPKWLGFSMLVPALNIGMLIWFAFREWPIETAIVRLEAGEPRTEPKAIWREE